MENLQSSFQNMSIPGPSRPSRPPRPPPPTARPPLPPLPPRPSSEEHRNDYSRRAGFGRQPRFIPGPAYDHALAKERMMAPTFGGRSKKAQLGSIEESWGPLPKSEEERAKCEGFKGMFELEDDPPSRNVSPFREAAEEDFETSLEKAWERARRGTGYVPEHEQRHQQEGRDGTDLRDKGKGNGNGRETKYDPERDYVEVNEQQEEGGSDRRDNEVMQEKEERERMHHSYDHYDGWSYDYEHGQGQEPNPHGSRDAQDVGDEGWTNVDAKSKVLPKDYHPEPHSSQSTWTASRHEGRSSPLHPYHHHHQLAYALDAPNKISQADEYRAWLKRSNGGMKKKDRWRS
ncbi:hypothetical protein IAT40_004359 [Kwoniella sp. CBS 6097]